jgi:UPF0176 protein
MTSYLTTAFYLFVALGNFKSIQPIIENFCKKNKIKGTILLASEGINGTISGQKVNIEAFHSFIRNDSAFQGKFSNLEHKESWATENPFYRMKVRIKKEIVALGVAGVSPSKKAGRYVKPENWNELISDPDTVLIDTRNDYEVDIGTFKKALNPKTKTFRDFPSYIEGKLKENKKTKIAMFCTGGIRCEKATSLMIEQGFENVYHLQGGILKYLEKIPQEISLWEGECFVFDQRVAVTHQLKEGGYDQCFACRHPLSYSEKQTKEYIKGISCSYCLGQLSKQKIASLKERQKQIELAKIRGDDHIGKVSKNGISKTK